jgi:Dolichyl-phosphate-mannose-protein mannosyltransferase
MVALMRRLDAWTAFMAESLQKCSGRVAVAVLFFMQIVAIGVASRKPLWYDEVVTAFTASLPSWRDLWRFYALGLDTTGPVPSLAARLGLRLPLAPEISLRLPFMLAFLCMSAGMYVFVRRRYAPGYALAALAIPMMLPDLFFYITEARAYALMLGAASLASCCWQAALDGKARPWSVVGLWIALAAAIAAHFFAIFLFIPFAAGQLTRDLTVRRVDWSVWLAILFFPAGYLVDLPGARRAHVYYANVFGHASVQYLYAPYRDMFRSFGWIATSVLLVLTVWLMRRWPSDSSAAAADSKRFKGFSRAEWVFSGTLALLPVYLALGSTALGVYRQIYALTFYIGFVLVVVAGLSEAARRRAGAGVAVFVTLLLCAFVAKAHAAVDGVHALLHPHGIHADLAAKELSASWARRAQGVSLPVALDPNTYLAFQYYAGADLVHRIYLLVQDENDPAFKSRIPIEEQHKRNMELFSQMLPVRATGFDDFLAQHNHFLIETHFDTQEWLPFYLLDREKTKGDLSITLLVYDPGGGSLLDVQVK